MNPPSDRLMFLQEAVATTAALRAADSLGVLARIDAGAVDAVRLARECDIGERGVHALLAALAALGLVEATLDGSFRAVARLGQLGALLRAWEGLAEAIRDDRPARRTDTIEGAERFYPNVVLQLGSWLAEVAECAADRFEGSGLRVLDVGAGSAPWSRALARRDPACRVTAVDLPEVLEVTRRAVETDCVASQFRYLGGDAFTLELELGAYDLAIVANFCHLFGESQNRRLLSRLRDTLHTGGVLAILDQVPNERHDGPRPVVLYGLGLLVRTSQGRVYPFSTYAAWLHQAGYEAVELSDLPSSPPTSLIIARRPA